MQKNIELRIFGAAKITLAGAALAGFLLFTGAPGSRADDDCQRRISRADHRLHEAIEHHGRESRQAEAARHNLHEAREDCYTRNHRWWDEDGHRWRQDRDWDDHDHDRYERERPPSR